MRFFNNKKIELLAPAGNFEIFLGIVDSKCDAIYFGGQKMNMRMIRKGYNFNDTELKEAVNIANERGKATYITLNNLLDYEELEVLEDYLSYISDIKATGIIVQDFAVLNTISKLNLDLEIHASVMMNVHNLSMIKALEKHKVNRIVLSRESSLSDASYFHSNSNIELEYFTHGDMCVSHGAQCYYSSVLFGMSSNRGKCLKPCRWDFTHQEETSYPLAVKDMCMISHLPEMIQSGITSFKIEGRMRDKDFIVNLVNQYGDTLDNYINDPLGYSYQKQEKWIFENRKRDLSNAYAFGNPGSSNINTRYEGTGKFYSTGKMFSTPTKEAPIDEDQISYINSFFKIKNTKKPKLSVRVDDEKQAKVAIEEGIDRIYLAADVFQPKKSFTICQLESLSKIKGETQLFLSTPRMMDEFQFDIYSQLLNNLALRKGEKDISSNFNVIDGLLISNLGALEAFKKYDLYMTGDYTLNIFNKSSSRFFLEEGLSELTPSIELSAKNLSNLLNEDMPFEVISHGILAPMYMSYDLYKEYGIDSINDLIFENEGGKYLVKRDVYLKNHFIMQKNYTLLPFVNRLNNSNLRIEGQLYSPEDLRKIIKIHMKAISGSDPLLEISKEDIISNFYNSCTFGSLRF